MLCFSHKKPKSDWIAPFQSYRALFPTNPTGQFFPVGQFFRPVTNTYHGTSVSGESSDPINIDTTITVEAGKYIQLIGELITATPTLKYYL